MCSTYLWVTLCIFCLPEDALIHLLHIGGRLGSPTLHGRPRCHTGQEALVFDSYSDSDEGTESSSNDNLDPIFAATSQLRAKFWRGFHPIELPNYSRAVDHIEDLPYQHGKPLSIPAPASTATLQSTMSIGISYVATSLTSNGTKKLPSVYRTSRKNLQVYGYRCSFHLIVFQGLSNPREHEYNI